MTDDVPSHWTFFGWRVLISFMAADPPFKVEEWTADDHILRLIAGADNLFVARAAFREAVAQYPRSILTLRQGARVVEEHKPSASGR